MTDDTEADLIRIISKEAKTHVRGSDCSKQCYVCAYLECPKHNIYHLCGPCSACGAGHQPVNIESALDIEAEFMFTTDIRAAGHSKTACTKSGCDLCMYLNCATKDQHFRAAGCSVCGGKINR